MSQVDRTDERGTGRYMNGVLTVIALLLGVLVLQSVVGGPGLSEAQAQRSRRTAAKVAALAPPNAAAQRVRMISELERISERLASLGSAMDGPIDVRVIEMPESAMTNVFDPRKQR